MCITTEVLKKTDNIQLYPYFMKIEKNTYKRQVQIVLHLSFFAVIVVES